MTGDLVERLRRIGDAGTTEARVALEAATELDRLGALLVQANDAFDEYTGPDSKLLVDGEPWREYRTIDPTAAPSIGGGE